MGVTHTHTHPKKERLKKKKKEIFMIGYATHVPKLRCSGNEEGVFWGVFRSKIRKKKLNK